MALLAVVLAAPPAAADPPEIFWDGGSVTAIASDGTHIFIASSGRSLESCLFAPTSEPVLLRVSKANPADEDVFLEACAADIVPMLTNGDSLYYRGGTGEIFVAPTDGSGSPVVLVAESTGASGLATDGTHIYWITRSGTTSTIHRAELATGLPQEVESFDNLGNFPRALEVDANHLYWAEGQIGSGAVRRMPKAGGAIQILADGGDGLDNTAFLAIDADYVYFGGVENNRLQRVPKVGGAVFDYVQNWSSEVDLGGGPMDDDRAINSLTLHGDWLVWTDTTGGYDGRVRRLDKSSPAVDDNEVTDLQLLALGPHAVHVSGGSVYWAQNEQVYRTPVDSSGVAIDLTLTHMEVTQALQNVPADGSFGDVPLVEDKTTWIRLYPWIEFAGAPEGVYVHQDHVTARVRGFRDGVELPGSPLEPATPELTIRQQERRKHVQRTFNFLVPASWRSGTVELQAEINPGGAIPESDFANNVIAGEFTFESPRPLCLVLVPVETGDGTPSVHDATMDDIVDLLKILWPTGRIHRGSTDAIHEAGGPYEIGDEDDAAKILNKLEWVRFWAEYPAGWCEDGFGRTHFVGVVEPSDEGYGGLARYDNTVCWIKKTPGQANFSIPTLLYFEEEFGTLVVPPAIPHGGGVLAQELAHNNCRRHVDCGSPEDVDTNYPYNTRYTYDETVNGHWGFDPRRMGSLLYEQWTLIRKEMYAADFMGYCAPRWVSDYTYRALLEESGGVSLGDGGGAGLLVVPFGPSDEILTVGALLSDGHVPEGGGEEEPPYAQFTGMHLLSGDVFSAEKRRELDALAVRYGTLGSPWTLDLIGDDGTLASYPFEKVESPGEHHGEAAILFPVRFLRETRRVAIQHDGATVATVDVSENFPIVQVLSPNGGEVLPDDLVIEWQSVDPDGDPLVHDIQYSPDGGQSWFVVAQDVSGTSYVMSDPRSIPGSFEKALVRVVASDGVRSRTDVSDAPFTLGFRSPRAYITSPKPDEVLAYGELTVLRGGATDPEEGELSAEQLVWYVDGQPAGIGEEVGVAGLAVGRHQAELWAVDAQQYSDVASVEFWVGRRLCPPASEKLEIVWLMENSSLMDLHAEEACERIESCVNNLKQMGLAVQSTVISVVGEGECSSGSVADVDPEAHLESQLDWHLGVESIARHHAWGDGTRVIIPMVKQVPEMLSSYASLVRPAAEAALANGVHVAPWLVPLVDAGPTPAIRQMASAIAAATDGVVLEWDAEANPVEIFSIKLTGSCSPEVDGIDPAGTVSPNRPVIVFGQHLRPGVGVEIGGQPAREVEHAEDGTWIRFLIPLDLEPGREHSLRLSRPGQRPVEVEESIVVTDPSDTTPPSIECPDDVHVACEDGDGAKVAFDVKATDETDPSPVVDCDPPSGSFFPVGTTTVTCRASDSAGNQSVCRFEVIVTCDGESGFRRGDSNGDGTVDLSDPLYSLSFLFLGGAPLDCPDAGDANDDSELDLTDAVSTLEYLFVGGEPLPAPGPTTCGPDPSDDAFGACTYSCR